MPFGTPGGDVQTQAMLQVLLNVFVHGQDVQARDRERRALPATATRRPSRLTTTIPDRLAVEAASPRT